MNYRPPVQPHRFELEPRIHDRSSSSPSPLLGRTSSVPRSRHRRPQHRTRGHFTGVFNPSSPVHADMAGYSAFSGAEFTHPAYPVTTSAPIPSEFDPQMNLEQSLDGDFESDTFTLTISSETEEMKQKERRKESNKIAQRRFREKIKAQTIQLERDVENIKQELYGAQKENESLKARLEILEKDNALLVEENSRLKANWTFE